MAYQAVPKNSYIQDSDVKSVDGLEITRPCHYTYQFNTLFFDEK